MQLLIWMIPLSIVLLVVIVISICLVVEISSNFFTRMVVCETAFITAIVFITAVIIRVGRSVTAVILTIVAVFTLLLILEVGFDRVAMSALCHRLLQRVSV